MVHKYKTITLLLFVTRYTGKDRAQNSHRKVKIDRYPPPHPQALLFLGAPPPFQEKKSWIRLHHPRLLHPTIFMIEI